MRATLNRSIQIEIVSLNTFCGPYYQMKVDLDHESMSLKVEVVKN